MGYDLEVESLRKNGAGNIKNGSKGVRKYRRWEIPGYAERRGETGWYNIDV